MIEGVLLAGGMGTRIGGKKPDRLLGGRTLLQRALDALQQVAPHIILSIAPGQEHPVLDARVPVILCEDLLPSRGPLTGIYTGLQSSDAEAVLVVPCDAPFLDPAVLRMLLARRHGFDAVVPETGGRLHPAVGVYARSCLPPLVDALNSDNLSIRGLLANLRVDIVPEEDLRALDRQLRTFFNVNTAADLRRAAAMLDEREAS